MILTQSLQRLHTPISNHLKCNHLGNKNFGKKRSYVYISPKKCGGGSVCRVLSVCMDRWMAQNISEHILHNHWLDSEEVSWMMNTQLTSTTSISTAISYWLGRNRDTVLYAKSGFGKLVARKTDSFL